MKEPQKQQEETAVLPSSKTSREESKKSENDIQHIASLSENLLFELSQLDNLKDLQFSKIHLIRSLLWFTMTAELLSMIEPQKIIIPIKKCVDQCNFQLFMCPCGFYTIGEAHLKGHFKSYHPLSKEVLWAIQKGQTVKGLSERVSAERSLTLGQVDEQLGRIKKLSRMMFVVPKPKIFRG